MIAYGRIANETTNSQSPCYYRTFINEQIHTVWSFRRNKKRKQGQMFNYLLDKTNDLIYIT